MQRKLFSLALLAVIVFGISTLASETLLARASGLPEDLNGDGVIDGKDVAIMAMAFGSYGPNFMGAGSPAHPRWNSICDLNGDNEINALDLGFLAMSFGRTA